MAVLALDLQVAHLNSIETLFVDILAWGLIHLGTGYAIHRAPVRWLDHDTWLFRARAFERDGNLYLTRFRILRWKDDLPEAGAMFAGGISKRSLLSDADGGLPRFAVETRRAELTHWLAMVPAPLFALWNPAYAVPLMLLYALAFNLPFIMIQRFNRLRILRILRRRTERSARAA